MIAEYKKMMGMSPEQIASEFEAQIDSLFKDESYSDLA